MAPRLAVLLTLLWTKWSFSVAADSYLTDPDWKITYTNQFKFQLKDVHDSPAVKVAAQKLGFVYNIQIVEEFFLYTRDDVARYSAEQYDVAILKSDQDALSPYVVSIEQDYERLWMADALNITFTGNNEFDDTRPTFGENSMFRASYSGSIMPASAPGATAADTICKRRPVNVAFIDYGFQMTHPNLEQAVNSRLSRSFFGDWRDVRPPFDEEDAKDALPYAMYEKISHGTRCMGRVGARTGRGCDAGVAPNVQLVGLKALDFLRGKSDSREAEALSYKHDEIDVFSCSYGARDNSGFHKPGPATQTALKSGATKGRDCRGVVYVYPSGNGDQDNCNADGYANSVDTITIAYVDKKGRLPKNVEVCTATIAAAVGGGYNTTDLNDVCSAGFKGSSASTAVAAGYAGELRYLRPCLSKRDIEHIMVRTAVHHGDITWTANGAGLKFHDQIGFGQLDLELMKRVAETWSLVPERHICEISVHDPANKHIVGTNWILKTSIPSDGCRDSGNMVQHLEHVQVALDLHCSNISQVAIQLVSPAGTASNLLTHINMTAKRVRKYNHLQWTFMSVNFWGEPAEGPWIVKLIVDDAATDVECEYTVEKLVLYGTETDPLLGGGHTSCKRSVKALDITASLSGGSIAAIVILTVVALGVLITVAACRYVRRRRPTNSHSSGYIATNTDETTAETNEATADTNEATGDSITYISQNSLQIASSENSYQEAVDSNKRQHSSLSYSNESYHEGD